MWERYGGLGGGGVGGSNWRSGEEGDSNIFPTFFLSYKFNGPLNSDTPPILLVPQVLDFC